MLFYQAAVFIEVNAFASGYSIKSPKSLRSFLVGLPTLLNRFPV
jgi:hypothetical protein